MCIGVPPSSSRAHVLDFQYPPHQSWQTSNDPGYWLGKQIRGAWDCSMSSPGWPTSDPVDACAIASVHQAFHTSLVIYPISTSHHRIPIERRSVPHPRHRRTTTSFASHPVSTNNTTESREYAGARKRSPGSAVNTPKTLLADGEVPSSCSSNSALTSANRKSAALSFCTVRFFASRPKALDGVLPTAKCTVGYSQDTPEK